MKALIFLLVALLSWVSSTPPMELRRRSSNPERKCISCIDSTILEKSHDDIKKKLVEDKEKKDEGELFKGRVFSEANQKENPTPVATLIVGSVAICCSGLLMLYNNFMENSK